MWTSQAYNPHPCVRLALWKELQPKGYFHLYKIKFIIITFFQWFILLKNKKLNISIIFPRQDKVRLKKKNVQIGRAHV